MILLNGVSTSTAIAKYRNLDLDLGDVPAFHPAYINTYFARPAPWRRPDPGLGRIAWPAWGANRYAIGHVVVGLTELTSLSPSSGASSLYPVSVQMKDLPDSSDTARTLAMYILSVRRVADTGDASQDFIVTLVDKRYWFANTVFSTSSTYATWGDLLYALASAWGTPSQSVSTINALIHADYKTPGAHFGPTYTTGTTVALLMDAVCAAVNLRPVFGADGSLTYQGSAAAGSALTSWLSTNYGDLSEGGTLYRMDAYERNDGTTAPTKTADPQIVFYTERLQIAGTVPTAGAAPLTVFLPDPGAAYRAALITKYTANLLSWQVLVATDATLAGLLAGATTAAIGTQVWEEWEGRCHTRFVADPPHYPWPLVLSIYPAESSPRYLASCLVANASTGVITGMRVTTVNSDGSTTCTEVPTCPEPGCPSVYYCVDGVVTAVAAGSAKPAGSVVLGPWATETEALENGCVHTPVAPLEWSGCCEAPNDPIPAPGEVWFNPRAKTGVALDLFEENSYPTILSLSPHGYPSNNLDELRIPYTPVDPSAFIGLQVDMQCILDEELNGIGYALRLQHWLFAFTDAVLTIVPTGGWTVTSTSTGLFVVHRTLDCGETWNPGSGELVGTVTVGYAPGLTGTYELWVSE